MLTADEIETFVRDGYLVLRGVLDRRATERALDYFWSAAPSDLRRGDPASWPGEFRPEDGSGDAWDVREGSGWRLRRPARDPWFLDLLPRAPAVRAVAEDLLGAGNLADPDCGRGIYCIRPEPAGVETGRLCHVDEHPFHLGLIGYLEDVPRGGGGLVVWPGTHRLLGPLFRSRHLFDPLDEFEATLAEVRGREPVDCWGQAGDVIVFHHRVGHAAGPNHSDRLRLAALADLRRRDLEARMGDPMDADFWRDWSPRLRRVGEPEEASP